MKCRQVQTKPFLKEQASITHNNSTEGPINMIKLFGIRTGFPALFLAIIIAANTGVAQTDTAETPISSTFNAMLESYKTPASTKEGLDRQLEELDKLRTSKFSEIQGWDGILNSVQRQIDDLANFNVDLDAKWKEIDALSKRNAGGKNNTSIVQNVNDIVQAFYVVQPTYFFPDNSPLSMFKDKWNENIKREIDKDIKNTSLVNIARTLSNNLLLPNANNSNDTRVQQILGLKNDLTKASHEAYAKSMTALLSDERNEANREKENANKGIAQIDKLYNDLVKAKEDKDISINHEAIMWGLPLFCFTIIVLFYGAFFYRRISLKQGNAAPDTDQSQDQITKVLLEIITVLLLTMTVLILGLSRILSENVLGTLLGGIAGYILNRNKNDGK